MSRITFIHKAEDSLPLPPQESPITVKEPMYKKYTFEDFNWDELSKLSEEPYLKPKTEEPIMPLSMTVNDNEQDTLNKYSNLFY